MTIGTPALNDDSHQMKNDKTKLCEDLSQIEENEFSNIGETKHHMQQSVEKGMLQNSETIRMSH